MQRQLDPGATRLTEIVLCLIPKQFVSRVSVVQRFLTQIDVNGKERGQISQDNALDGDKNVSMELYSKTKIAALYLMCTHFILAICLK